MNLYSYYKQVALDTGSADHVDMNTDTVKCALLENGGFTATDKYLSDVLNTTNHPGVNAVARSGALATPTVTNGTFSAANEVLSAVPSGHTINAVVLYKDTGVDTTCTVIAYIDKQADGVTAISLPTNGSDITVTWNAAGIFDI